MIEFIDRLANVLIILGTIFSSLIDITIMRIHIRQSLLKEGFFHVVFGQVISELIINISLLFLNFVYLISGSSLAGKWIVIFPVLFNFGYIANIVYNIRIIYFLMTFNNEIGELISYDDKNKDEIKHSLTRSSSIALQGMSFKNFHLISYGIATIHTILYIINLTCFQEVEIQSDNWNWYYYFICGEKYFWRIFFFIFHIIYFIISIPYMYNSCDKNKISNHIYLRSYSFFCFFSSIISLFIPIVLVIFMCSYSDDVDTFNSNYIIILLIAFLVFILSSAIFRINCYYVNFILVQDGKNCLKRWGNAIKILICIKPMEKLNFVDLNSAYIYHALASANDFILDDYVEDKSEMVILDNEKIETNDELGKTDF